jgi:hypothetical protein
VPQTALSEYIKDATVPPPSAAKSTAAAAAPAGKPAAAGGKGGKGGDAAKAPAEAAAKPAAAKPAAPAAPAGGKAKDEVPAGVDAKKWKTAVKEGGKKGVELAGCADMGGLEFFTTQVASAGANGG